LESINIAALASKNIIDGPEYGHRMMIKTTKLPTKPRRFSNKHDYAWNFEKAKWSKCREKLEQFHMLTLIFKMKLPIKNCEKYCSSILSDAKQYIPKSKTQNISQFKHSPIHLTPQ
jgi:hypothetical protein